MKDEDGVYVGVFPSAFDPDDEGVSVTWLEFFGGSPAEQLDAAREAMGRRRTIRKNNGLAVLNVGKVLDVGRSLSVETRVTYDPDMEPGKENPAHCLIAGIRPDHEELKGRLAVLGIARLEPGISGSWPTFIPVHAPPASSGTG